MSNLRITANIRTKINELVNILTPMLPLTSRTKKTITFTTIFAESGIADYLDDEIKKKALQKGWEEVIRKHPKVPYTLVRKIVPASISYRRHKRDPLKKQELVRLAQHLYELGYDMRKELAQIELDESIPVIQVPPDELVKRLEVHPLTNEIAGEPLQLFKNGHFNESVRKAAEKFEVKVQNMSGMKDIGKDLMAKAFKLDAPVIKLNSLSTDNDKGIQEGYQLMTMGMIRAIRNVFSHGDEKQRSPEECYEMLLFINWLFRQIN